MKIIAESAFNHQGNLDYLIQLATAAKTAGADYFTVQIYNTDHFCDPEYSKYQICKETEHTAKNWELLYNHCIVIGMQIIPCVLDDWALNLIEEWEFDYIKLHATDLLNIPFLETIKQKHYPVILETQCATQKDIDEAMAVIGNQVAVLFHGFSNYPTEYDDLNLNALDYIRKKWGKPVGFADHTQDTLGVPVMLLAKGTEFIEKHITLSRNDRQYDWQVSLEPHEFAVLVHNVRQYTKTLGSGYKHPVANELPFRTIMYKKFTGEIDSPTVVRSNNGADYYDWKYRNFDRRKVVGAVIARLKSQRLKQKVFLPLQNDLMVFDMISRVSTSKKLSAVILASSWLDEDSPLLQEGEKRGIETYAGDPISVVERLISVAESQNAWGVFRITGDNPLTDPVIIDNMIDLFTEHHLDYVRANNLPFGITAELFSVKYLINLYNKMVNPLQSEYLTWFVLLDKEGRKGAIDFNSDHPSLFKVNYSVDYEAEYNRVKRLISKTGKQDFTSISLRDIVENSEFDNLMDSESEIKLPGQTKMKYMDFIKELKSMDYIVRKTLSLGDL